MYHDKMFEEALEQSKRESYNKLQQEVKSMECAIERFLSQILECTSTISERDFNVCSV